MLDGRKSRKLSATRACWEHLFCAEKIDLLFASRPLEFRPSERQFLFLLVLTLVAVGRYSTLRLSITQKDPICQKRDDLLWSAVESCDIGLSRSDLYYRTVLLYGISCSNHARFSTIRIDFWD